jgi:adenylate cyclase
MNIQLHTFLFADISGYSTLTELEGDDAAAEIAIRFADEVARLAPDHGADFVRRIGDAVLVHCVNAADAIELGLRLQTEPVGVAGERALPQIHTGIHTGPAVWRAGEWWGATVNIAARVAAAAEAGQVLITEATRRASGESCGFQLKDRGLRRLKNISAPVYLYSPCHDVPGSVARGVLQTA